MRKGRWVVAFGVLAGAACGSSSPTDNPVQLQPPPGPAVAADTMNVVDNSFDPQTVKVTVGGTVTWTWSSSNTMQHNVRWATWPGSATSPPNSGTQATGAPFDATFTYPGMYEFGCTLHTGMSGAVFVE